MMYLATRSQTVLRSPAMKSRSLILCFAFVIGLPGCFSSERSEPDTVPATSTIAATYSLSEADVQLLIQVEAARMSALARLEEQRGSESFEATDRIAGSPASDPEQIALGLGLQPEHYRRALRRIAELRVVEQVASERAASRRFHEAHLESSRRLLETAESDEEIEQHRQRRRRGEPHPGVRRGARAPPPLRSGDRRRRERAGMTGEPDSRPHQSPARR